MALRKTQATRGRPFLSICLFVHAAAVAGFGCRGVAADDPAVRAAIDSLDTLWRTGRHEEFRTAIVDRSAAAIARGDTSLTIALLVLGGARDVSVGCARPAEDSLRWAAALAQASRDTLQEMPARRWLAVALGQQGRSAEATAVCEGLLDLALACGDRRHEGWAHVGLAWSDLQRGRTATARTAYESAETALREAGDAEGEIWARNGLAMTMSRGGDLRGALAVYAALVARSAELGLVSAEAMAVNNTGHCLYLLGDPGAAQAAFERARRLQTERGQAREALTPALNLALCLQDLGQFAAAAETLQQCRERGLAGGYLDVAGEAILELANLERRLERPRGAALQARRALALGDRLPAQDRARATVILAESLADLDSAATALGRLEQVRGEVPAAAMGAVAHDLELALARVQMDLARSDAALVTLDGVVNAACQAGDDRALIQAQLQRGRLLAALGRADDARRAFQDGLTVWERQRALPVEPHWRESRAAAGQALAMELAGLILESGAPDALDRAYRILQTGKARTLLERRLGPGVVVPSARFAVPLDSLRAGVLREGECLLDLYLGERTALLFAVAPETAAAYRLGPPADLERRARSLRALLAEGAGRSGDAPRLAALRAATSGLQRDIFGPAAAISGHRRHVILAADGAVHGVPFGGWSRTPSAAMLARIRGEPAPPPLAGATPLLLITGERLPDGRRLDGVRREQRRLARRFAGLAVEVRPDAGEEFRARYAGAAVIHVAAHAEVSDQAPWRSALHVAGGNAGSEALRPWFADEIAATPTGAGLVVLSSCATAQGRVVSGEGLLGLATAFLAAGAHAVVGTLWPIDDAAGALVMDRFYEELAVGQPVGAALARACAIVAQRREHADPFHWAGYVVFGDGGLTVPVASAPAD